MLLDLKELSIRMLLEGKAANSPDEGRKRVWFRRFIAE